MEQSSANTLNAFLVSTIAGFSTMLGALTICTPCFKKTRYTIFAYTNAFAGGVMLFVAMCEILQTKAIENFVVVLSTYGDEYERFSYAAGYGFYFVGCVLCYLFSLLMDLGLFRTNLLKLPEDALDEPQPQPQAVAGGAAARRQTEAVELERARASMEKTGQKEMCSMAINMFVALTVHNVPEGIITFTEVYNEGALGLPLAIAIAIHNIPEGMAIAIPVFYATGSLWKSIASVAVASIAEPLGGVVGYFIISKTKSAWFNAVAFSIISGVMSWIVIYEMVPLSLKYSKSRFLVAFFFVLGSLVMATSLAGIQMA